MLHVTVDAQYYGILSLQRDGYVVKTREVACNDYTTSAMLAIW